MAKHNTHCGTILLVEDSIPLLRNAAFLLEIAGYRVMTATNGQEGMDSLLRQRPDLIISDIEMPQMDGYQFLQKVRADRRWRSIPFILVSSKYELDDLMYGLDLGADDYLPKPYDIYDLLDAIRRTLPQMTDDPQRKAG
jgi:DNA-binding response OmpR family regulator